LHGSIIDLFLLITTPDAFNMILLNDPTRNDAERDCHLSKLI